MPVQGCPCSVGALVVMGPRAAQHNGYLSKELHLDRDSSLKSKDSIQTCGKGLILLSVPNSEKIPIWFIKIEVDGMNFTSLHAGRDGPPTCYSSQAGKLSFEGKNHLGEVSFIRTLQIGSSGVGR